MTLIMQRSLSKKHTPCQAHHHWLKFTRLTPFTLTKVAIINTAVISLLNLTACQTTPTVQAAVTQTIPNQITSTSVITNQAIIIDDLKSPKSNHASGNNDSNTAEETTYTVISDDSIIYLPNEDMYSYSHSDEYYNTDVPKESEPDISAEHTVEALPSVLTKPQPIPQPSYNDLLTQARQNSQQSSSQNTSDQGDLPAFRKLMEVGVNQLKAGQLTAAESSFTRAQRLAPKSSAVYFYLSQVALKKNQPHKAEAMARRGLSVSEDASRKQALWQIILQAAQLQNNQRVIEEARQALR